MLFTLIGCYAAVALIYWCIKYRNTNSEKNREEARKDFLKSYCECLRWPVELLHGIRGFGNDDHDLQL